MGKILAIVFLVIFAWFAVPRLAQAQWFAPTLYPASWWGAPLYDYSPRLGQQGYGWFGFGFGSAARYNPVPVSYVNLAATSYYPSFYYNAYPPVPTPQYTDGYTQRSFRPTTGGQVIGPGYSW